MSAESALYALLSGAAGVTALVSTRIYPDVLPEECAYPAVVFARVRTEPVLGIHGASFGDDVELVIGCWAETRTVADAVADAVAAALSGSAFWRSGQEAGFDPETGLFVATVTAEYFDAT